MGRRHDATRSAAGNRAASMALAAAAAPPAHSSRAASAAASPPSTLPPAEMQSSGGSEATTRSCDSCTYALQPSHQPFVRLDAPLRTTAAPAPVPVSAEAAQHLCLRRQHAHYDGRRRVPLARFAGGARRCHAPAHAHGRLRGSVGVSHL